MNDHFQDLIDNVLSLRRDWFRALADPRRDVNDECGWPVQPEPALYQELFDRDPIANRVVSCLPRECWQVQPLVFESEAADEATEFENAWDGLAQALRGRSWFQDEAASPVWEYLLRADILSGIGQYGVILLGLDDLKKGEDLRKPATEARNLRFIRVFPETLAQITKFNQDPSSPRNGQPEEYLVTFNSYTEQSGGNAVGLSSASMPVHWSRVIHVADNPRSSEVFGTERMRPVLNRLLDIRKVLGASAEGYWKSAFTGLSFETHPQLGGDVSVDREGLRDMYEQFQNGLQRALFLSGMTAKTLAPTVIDPTSHITAQIESICVQLGIPVRIFKGSERGELASSQDDDAWNDRLKQRQASYLTPRIIVPFVDRLIQLGVLPTPQGYSVQWPDLTSTSADQRAGTFQKRMAGLAAYISGHVDTVLAPMDLLTRELGYSEEEAAAILDASASRAADEEEQPKNQTLNLKRRLR